jgi:hypothetical protein
LRSSQIIQNKIHYPIIFSGKTLWFIFISYRAFLPRQAPYRLLAGTHRPSPGPVHTDCPHSIKLFKIFASKTIDLPTFHFSADYHEN